MPNPTSATGVLSEKTPLRIRDLRFLICDSRLETHFNRNSQIANHKYGFILHSAICILQSHSVARKNCGFRHVCPENAASLPDVSAS